MQQPCHLTDLQADYSPQWPLDGIALSLFTAGSRVRSAPESEEMGYSPAQLYYLCTQEVPQYLHHHLCKAPPEDSGESGVSPRKADRPPPITAPHRVLRAVGHGQHGVHPGGRPEVDVPKCPEWAKRNIDSSDGQRPPATQTTVQVCSGQPGRLECAPSGRPFPLACVIAMWPGIGPFYWSSGAPAVGSLGVAPCRSPHHTRTHNQVFNNSAKISRPITYELLYWSLCLYHT